MQRRGLLCDHSLATLIGLLVQDKVEGWLFQKVSQNTQRMIRLGSTHLRHSKLVLCLVRECDVVFLVRFHVAKPAQIDYKALIDVGWNLSISEGISVNVIVLGIFLGQREINLREWGVEREGKGIISMTFSERFDDVFALDTVDQFPIKNDLTEGHRLLSQVVALRNVPISSHSGYTAKNLTKAGSLGFSPDLWRIPGVRTAPAQTTYFLAWM